LACPRQQAYFQFLTFLVEEAGLSFEIAG